MRIIHSSNYDWRLIVLLLSFIVATVSISSTDNAKGSNNQMSSSSVLVGMQSDPFVMAAPFVIAATCREGIVIMASHPNLPDEPLLKCTDTQQLSPRIPAMDGLGTSMASCGWRADSQALTARVQQLAANHRREFGIPTHSRIYDRRLAMETSLYLAKQAVAEGTRPFSCASLLAVPQRETAKGGTLWLLDATGAYRIRALCLGGGRIPSEHGNESPKDFATVVNQRLLKIDFSEMTLEECQKTLIELLVGTADSDHSEHLSPLLKEETVVEIALIEKSSRRVSAEKLNPAIQL